MILCLDVGNSHLFGGVFDEDKLLIRFRHQSKAVTSDEIGVFLKAVLRENNVDPALVSNIAMCSVVPNIDYSLRSACIKYFACDPFIVQSGIKTGLKINYRNPIEVGADRITTAIASSALFPNTNIINIDFGTATTVCAITEDKRYLGGAIMPGLRLAMESLQSHAAKLPSVEILKPLSVVGRSTIESIQSGLYMSTLGACRELISKVKQEAFHGKTCKVIATGGFAALFEGQGIYDINLPDLILDGLRIALRQNI